MLKTILFLIRNIFQKQRLPSKDIKQLPATAEWDIKGNGVAYTTSQKIINSVAGQKAINDSKKLFLRLQTQNKDIK